jgi:glycosyltransferase involved in cell wall biosynthesis
MQRNPPCKCGGKRLKGVIAENGADQPLVSVITSVLNGGKFLTACLESVLSQDYPNIEHIVIDGGSTDGTVDLLRRYDDRVALWKSEPDNGIYDAWNKGLSEAGGEWICFLGSDDEFLPHAIGSYMRLAVKRPDAEYLSSKVLVVHPSGYLRTLGRPWSWRKFSQSMCTPHPGSMHRRRLFERLGTYDLSYRIVGDYELLLRAHESLSAAYMPVVTVRMRFGGVSTTSRALDEEARAKLRTGGRSRLLTLAELFAEKVKLPIRPPVRYVLGKVMARRSSSSLSGHI